MGMEAPKDSASSKASLSSATGDNRFGFLQFRIQEQLQ
jgi:hypothetical protein